MSHSAWFGGVFTQEQFCHTFMKISESASHDVELARAQRMQQMADELREIEERRRRAQLVFAKEMELRQAVAAKVWSLVRADPL